VKIIGSKGYYAADYFNKHLYEPVNNYVSPDRLIVDLIQRTKLDVNDNMTGNFAACIRGKRTTLETTLEDGIAAIKVMNAADESMYRNF